MHYIRNWKSTDATDNDNDDGNGDGGGAGAGGGEGDALVAKKKTWESFAMRCGVVVDVDVCLDATSKSAAWWKLEIQTKNQREGERERKRGGKSKLQLFSGFRGEVGAVATVWS